MKKMRFVTFLKYRFKKFIPQIIWINLAKNIQKKRELEFDQRYISNVHGQHKPAIYVIRRRPPGGGLFSNVNHVLQGIEYAKYNHLTPIVDMQNYWTSYSQRPSFNSSKNAWDYFFEPISNIKIENIEKYQHLFLSKGDRILPSSPLADRGLSFVLDRKMLLEYNRLYTENIKLNKPTQEFINRVKEFLIWEKSSIGVSYRGTDYVFNQPTGHARQPSFSHLLSRLETKLEQNCFSRLFVSTEDNEARNIINSAYSKTVYKEFRDQKTMEKLVSDRHNHSKQTIGALGYLAEVYLLSECLSITCSIANGSATALMINGGRYSDPDIINIGVYE